MNTRKRITNVMALVLVAMGIVGLTTGVAKAQVIYSDSFTRTGVLHGSAPDTAPGAETWIAGGWETDGVAATAITGDNDGAGYLPFVPALGTVYTLKATFDVSTGHDSWYYGIGFTSAASTGAPQQSLVPAYIYESKSGYKAYAEISNSFNPNVGSGAAGLEYAIEMDTRPALWIFKFYRDGIVQHTYTNSANVAINYVALGNWYAENDGTPDTLDDFELKEGPYYDPTTPPAGGTVAVQSIVLQVEGSDGTLQWQESADNSTWSDVAGAILTRLDVTPRYESTPWFRVKVSRDGFPDEYSTTMQVTTENVAEGMVIIVR